ncbi:MAG: carbohydrate porin [Pyrinomonadaceae bacterium]|nr:carbohydrate porin [Pyrinomonadaceae bacterium]
MRKSLITGPIASAAVKPKSETLSAASLQEAKPTPTPEVDFWHRETVTGDWDGARTRWKEEGVELEFKLTQFYQVTVSGGVRHENEYNGVFETNFKFDLGKIAGWKYWSAEIQSETRFGGPALGGIGTINPVNTAAIIPGANGSVVSVTALNFTRLIPKDLKKGDLFAVSFGRFNLLDLLNEDFFAGSGKERFFNMAGVGPLRQVGQAFVWRSDHDQRIYAVRFHQTDRHPWPADQSRPATARFMVSQLRLPAIHCRARQKGWLGFFHGVSFADKATSPITTFLNLGVGGNGLFKSRQRDEFGINYAFTDLSKVLKDNLDLVTQGGRRPRAEHQLEIFYNLHITPWLRLTGDLQIIRPTRDNVTTAVVPGARMEVIF